MTKDQMLNRIHQLLSLCSLPVESRAEPEQVLNGALTVMIEAYRGSNSDQVKSLLKRRDHIAEGSLAQMVRKGETILAVKGALENLRQEVEAGLLTSLEQRITSDVLSDLIQLARAALAEPGEGPKNVAAVLVAAAYEDTLRRIAKEHAGVIGQDKLESVIGELKAAGLLVPPQLGIAQSHLNFRNRALHAQWDTIDRVGVETVLAFVEQLLLKHFG